MSRLRACALPLAFGALALGLFHAIAAASTDDFAGHPRWDEGYYATIAARGYSFDPNDHLRASNVVFSPGYPLLLRALWHVTGLHPHPGRLVLSAGLFLIAVALAHALFATATTRPAIRTRATLALVTAPGAMFAMVGYAEALALPLVLGFFLALAKGHRVLACACAAAALFTRSPAILLPVTLGILTVLDAAASATWRAGLGKLVRLVLLELPICGLGVAGYLLVLHLEVGNPLAFLDAYVAWNPLEPATAPIVPWIDPVAVLVEAARQPSIWVAAALCCVCPPLLLLERLRMPLAFFVYGTLAWLFFVANENSYRTPLGNWIRWLGMVFPLAFALAMWSERGFVTRFRLFWIWIGLQVLASAWLAHRFAVGEWVS